jgi:UDPglucose 6-dehydrogenase
MSKITVVGIGYVGLSNGLVLSQQNEVIFLDIDSKKVDMINQRKSPIKEDDVDDFLKRTNIHISATLDKQVAYENADYVIIATPTNYDVATNQFDTTSIENVIQDVIQINPTALIVIKSTVPIGYTDKVTKKFNHHNIIFSPEFLREGNSLMDNLYPSRIIVGYESDQSIKFARLLKNACYKPDVIILSMSSADAESVKLFSNTYLAMRVAFFNELDTYASYTGLNTLDIIEGVCLDPRIGSFYNNPSFGYGGYCFPKDTKQLLANYKNLTVPQNLIQAIVDSNETRKKFIIDDISFNIGFCEVKKIGIYRLLMKEGSDNFRQSAIHDIILGLQKYNVEILIYEPLTNETEIDGCKVVKDLNKFKKESQLILANRLTYDLNDVVSKTYTKDVFSRD